MSTPDTTDNIYSKEETLQAFGGGTIVLAPGDVVEVYIVTDNNLPVYEATHTIRHMWRTGNYGNQTHIAISTANNGLFVTPINPQDDTYHRQFKKVS